MKIPPGPPRAALITALQNAYSGELAAWHAYEGHWRSLLNAREIAEIQKIQDEERVHRDEIGEMLRNLGTGPRPMRERVMSAIGRAIGLLCRMGGWLIPMYGAGALERSNIVEYEIAAELARRAGLPHLVAPLIRMASVEWDHEAYFRKKVESHWLGRRLPLWPPPGPRPHLVSEAATKDSNRVLTGPST